MNKKYLEIEEQIDYVSVEGSLLELIEKFEKLIEVYGESVCIKEEWGGYEGGVEPILYYKRKETDKERDERLEKKREAREEKKEQKRKKEEQERKQYEKLKEKFEND